MAVKFPLAQRIGWRYFCSSRDFLRSVASIAMFGFAFSIAILVITQAILSGFETELGNRVLNLVPHVTIQSRSGTMEVDDIEAELDALSIEYRGSPEIESNVLLAVQSQRGLDTTSVQPPQGRVEAARLIGIDPDKHSRASAMGLFVNAEAMSRLAPGSFQILVGRDKARELGVTEGDFITVVTMEPTLTLVGAIPRQKRFRVAGIIDTLTFLDAELVYIHVEDAARLSRISEGITTYKLQIEDPFEAQNLVDDLVPRRYRNISRYDVSAWSEHYGYLVQSIVASRNMLVLIFSLMVAIAAFNLVSTVVVFVNERKQDIAVLLTLGGGRMFIGSLFLISGLMISCLGLLFGSVLGVLLGISLEIGFPVFNDLFGRNLLQEYFTKTLNVEFVLSDFVLVVIIGLSLSVLASLYPAWRAMKLDPAEVLRRD